MEALVEVASMEAFVEFPKASEKLIFTEAFVEASVKAFVKVTSMESFFKAVVEAFSL